MIWHFDTPLTAEEKERLADDIASMVATATGQDPGAVSVDLRPVEPSEWSSAVVEPYLRPRWDQIVRRPTSYEI
jgi:phenylpyruvate tautomerase PptA (4-oxalocrotonate tautomerase family)